MEAVSDSSAKRLRVVSAYITKKEAGQEPNAFALGTTSEPNLAITSDGAPQLLNIPDGPQHTPEAPVGSTPNSYIPQARAEINSKNDKINRAFNDELKSYISSELSNDHIFRLGVPGYILTEAGFPEGQQIEMSASRLKFKERLHRYNAADLINLPEALQSPVAIFSYGDKGKAQNVIVELKLGDKNFLIGAHFNQGRRGVEVSDIRTIFAKDTAEWLNWINQGKLVYADIEKLQSLIDQQRINFAEVEYLELEPILKLLHDNKEVNHFFPRPGYMDDYAGQNKSNLARPMNAEPPSHTPEAKSSTVALDSYILQSEPEVNLKNDGKAVETTAVKEDNIAKETGGENDGKHMHTAISEEAGRETEAEQAALRGADQRIGSKARGVPKDDIERRISENLRRVTQEKDNLVVKFYDYEDGDPIGYQKEGVIYVNSGHWSKMSNPYYHELFHALAWKNPEVFSDTLGFFCNRIATGEEFQDARDKFIDGARQINVEKIK